MFENSFINRFCLIALLALISGCSSGYHAQPHDLPTDALESALEDASKDPTMHVTQSMPADWWILFNDSQLEEFILTAFVNNPTLQIAQANILKAAYNADLARAPLFPNLNWGGDVSREKLSETGIIPFSPTGPTTGSAPTPTPAGMFGIPVYFTQYETELLLTYDFDIGAKTAIRFAPPSAKFAPILPMKRFPACN